MREVTVIASAHKKQPYVVDRQACNKIGPPESNKKDCETGQMCRQKRQRSQQRYPFAVAQYDCAGCHAADLLSSERSEPLQALSFCRFTPACPLPNYRSSSLFTRFTLCASVRKESVPNRTYV